MISEDSKKPNGRKGMGRSLKRWEVCLVLSVTGLFKPNSVNKNYYYYYYEPG
jgi:hypothetical protein